MDDDRIVGAALRVIVVPGVCFGPGKIALLQGIKTPARFRAPVG